MDLGRRAESMRALARELRPVAAVYQRVGELISHIVAAHGAAFERLVGLAADASVLEDDPDIAEILWIHRPAASDDDAVDRYGNRIEALLSAIEQSATPPIADVAGRLTAETTEFYGEALERAFTLLHESGQGDAIRAALGDDLVASLLVVHGLHPQSMYDRVQMCLADLAETLGETGGAVEFVGIDDDEMVTVRINGGSDIHRWRTRLAVEKGIDRAAPDHGGIEVLGARNEPPPVSITTYIPIESIRRSAPRRTPRRWIEVPDLATLADEDSRRFSVDDVSLVACNVGGDLFVAVDPIAGAAPQLDDVPDGLADDMAVRLVALTPPTVETTDGRRLVFDAPLPVQRTDDGVEVMVP